MTGDSDEEGESQDDDYGGENIDNEAKNGGNGPASSETPAGSSRGGRGATKGGVSMAKFLELKK